jgi:flagellum-specific peptidoglycan hydrolase FlgJ
MPHPRRLLLALAAAAMVAASDPAPDDPPFPGNDRREREAFARAVRDQFAAWQAATPGACGLDPCTLAAQWMAESNWGRSALARNARNLGGMKGRGPAGVYEAPTREFENGVERATAGGFRRYDRLTEFYADYVALVCEGDRYKDARGKRGRDYYEALRRAGYSTNPRYAEELMVFYRQIGCEER